MSKNALYILSLIVIEHSLNNAAWIEEGGDTNVEASEGESDSETSSESHTSTCSDQSNKSNRSNNSTCLTDDGEFLLASENCI